MDAKALYRLLIRRLFFAQLAILGAIGVLVVIGLLAPSQLFSLPMAFLAGGVGGSIALIRRLPKVDEAALEALSSGWIETCMPLLYGSLMGVVAYFLFMSGILTGDGGGGLFTSNLFPIFETSAPTDTGERLNMEILLYARPQDTVNLGKLLIWCLIAGHSQKFVQGVLGTLEDRSIGGGGKRSE